MNNLIVISKKIVIMNELIRKDGYINATAICKAGNKKFNDWHRLACTKALINLYEKHTQIPKEKLLTFSLQIFECSFS